ncbi:hypothetical protein [Pseudoneobacillus rhizosphaerae]|uniref:hypothetical protein n=1 Tax=Pseudoneobacillus rhizosphaerae TaxID=2880968 RepID=UPI001E5184B8|nr:hypothetical protein [Pseudoneobacillus rhizosphaerae]
MPVNNDLYRVLIPERIFQEAVGKEQLKMQVLQYMARYPHYQVKSIQKGFAICIRKE